MDRNRQALYLLPAFAQDIDNIKGRAAAQAHQHEFHGTTPAILPALLWRTIHGDCMPVIVVSNKVHIVLPIYLDLHMAPSSSLR
jgi:Ser/Thr protein kinase RdoA (MazF antagonist)